MKKSFNFCLKQTAATLHPKFLSYEDTTGSQVKGCRRKNPREVVANSQCLHSQQDLRGPPLTAFILGPVLYCETLTYMIWLFTEAASRGSFNVCSKKIYIFKLVLICKNCKSHFHFYALINLCRIASYFHTWRFSLLICCCTRISQVGISKVHLSICCAATAGQTVGGDRVPAATGIRQGQLVPCNTSLLFIFSGLSTPGVSSVPLLDDLTFKQILLASVSQQKIITTKQ